MASTGSDLAGIGGAFTAEENEQLTRVGLGTPMGELFRQYWIPVLPVSLLEEEVPRRIRLLGEDLVLFRTGRGELGLVGAFCSHRLAPLFFGRIEDDGIRCPYHGWKYGPGGQCLAMPNVPQFKDLIKAPRLSLHGAWWDHLGVYGSCERLLRCVAYSPPLAEWVNCPMHPNRIWCKSQHLI